MKPFNLTEALAGKPVVTRGNEGVTQLTIFSSAAPFSIAGVVGSELLTFTTEGKFNHDESESTFDLFMAPLKKELWINLHKQHSKFVPAYFYEGEEEAKRHVTIGDGFIKSIKIHEYEE